MAKSTNYEAPHYVIFSNFLSLHRSYFQLVFSILCVQEPSIHTPPLCERQSFTHMQNNRQNYSFVYFNLTFLGRRRKDKILYTEWLQAFPELNLLIRLYFFVMQLRFKFSNYYVIVLLVSR
jgi:hypothetical protein